MALGLHTYKVGDIMKTLILATGVFLSLYVNTVASERYRSKTISELITMAAQDHKVDRTYLSCLLKIESDYRYKVISSTNDHGIGQINAKTARIFNFNLSRLTTDLEYSIDRAAYMLSYYQWLKKYDEGRTWVCRYNVGSGSLTRGNIAEKCEAYLERFYACTTGDLKGVL
mgnify:CR=1 FL=1